MNTPNIENETAAGYDYDTNPFPQKEDLGLKETKSQTSQRGTPDAEPIRVGPSWITCPTCGIEYNTSSIHECDRWQFITSNTAWKLCEKFGGKAAPYAGYMIELTDGRAIRCRKDSHKTIFEIRAASNLNISATNTATT